MGKGGVDEYMEISIRRAAPADIPKLPAVFRDANDSLRKSQGGLTPDKEIDRLNALPDSGLRRNFTRGAVLFVAEVRGTGEIAGMGALTDNFISRIVGSTYSRSHYVLRAFQHGKGGVSVGRLLREATIAEAKRLGFRKMYGYSTAEAIGYHKKFGAVFHPQYDFRVLGNTLSHYYEIELRRSALNWLHIEPYIFRLGMLLGPGLGPVLAAARRTLARSGMSE
jgi:hypothetical protein